MATGSARWWSVDLPALMSAVLPWVPLGGVLLLLDCLLLTVHRAGGASEVSRVDHGNTRSVRPDGVVCDAGELAGCSNHTVAGWVTKRDEGRLSGEGPIRRERIIDPFLDKIEEWVERSQVKIGSRPRPTDPRGIPTGHQRAVLLATSGQTGRYRQGLRPLTQTSREIRLDSSEPLSRTRRTTAASGSLARARLG